jgi:4-amino-4-deoxy-L-arabinose transferase-like glycosyltransferase
VSGPPRSLILLLIAAEILLVAWSFAVPMFESPDEPAHWQYARYLYDTWRLPPYHANFQEGNSPPLYYALIAPIAAHEDEPPLLIWQAPPGNVIAFASPRVFQNAWDDLTGFPRKRAARLLTTLMALGAVAFAFLAGRESTGRTSTGLLAGGFVALLPQFSFRGMNISNDALVTMLSAAALYGMVLMIRRGYSRRRNVLTVAAMAGAFLAKISAVFLPVPYCLAISATTPQWNERLRRAAWLALAVLIASPWLIRNQLVHGDPLAMGAMHAAVSHIIVEKPLFSGYFITEFPLRLGLSFVGVFGWMNVVMGTWAYGVYLGVAALAVAGHMWSWRRLVEDRVIHVLVAIIVLAFAMVVRINLEFDQAQGRYLFTALGAAAVFVALGLEALPFWSLRWSAALLALLAFINVNALVNVWHVYWPPVLERTSTRVLLKQIPHASADGGSAQGVRYRVGTDVRQLHFLKCQLQGRASERVVRGAVRFTTTGSGKETTVPFEWVGDGNLQYMIIGLFREPGWRGTIDSLEMQPVMADVGARVESFSVKDLRLCGRTDC